MNITAGASKSLLVGEANGYEATTLLRFGPLEPWQETRYITGDDGEAISDVLTFTPLNIRLDTAAYFRVAFSSYVADSGISFLQAYVATEDWANGDSVQAPLPPLRYTTPLVESDTLDTDPDEDYPLTTMRVPTNRVGQLAGILSDSLTILVKGLPGTNMLEMPSINATTTYSPQLVFWIDAKVESAQAPEQYEGMDPDTLIGISLRPIQDTYRIERTGTPVSPTPGRMMVAGGSPWRGWVRFDRFDMPGFSVDGKIPEGSHASANSAILEISVANDGNWFQGDDVTLQVLSLVEEFSSDSGMVNALSVYGNRLTAYGFSESESSISDDYVRRFQIADIVNAWWRDPDNNFGFLVKNSVETNNVNSLEITGMRVLLVTSTPPLLAKPANESGIKEGGDR